MRAQTKRKSEAAPLQKTPTWEHETDVCSHGYGLVAGVDEAGRGAWAGPLVAGAVILPHPSILQMGDPCGELAEGLASLRDSKMLSAHVREELLELIKRVAVGVGVGVVSSALLDTIGVGPANRLAMARAVRALSSKPDYLLLDAFRIHSMPLPQRPIIRGDATCISIAAASIVAKVARDRMMTELDPLYPEYGFSQHKGYGTRRHAEALLIHGATPAHRRSFAPIQAALTASNDEGCVDAESLQLLETA
jgi:ribonuclease HII